MKNSLLLVLIFALFPAQGYSENLDGQALAKNLYRLILKGDSKSILSAFDNAPNIDTPRTGAIRGRKNLVQFIASENNWLREHGIVENSLAEVRTTISEDRIIYEQRLTLEKTSPMKHHRFAVVVDLKGKQADSVRIYYALNDITGRNDFSRPSMLENDPALFEGVAAPAKQYLSSIDNAYRDVYRMFVDDACFSALCGKTKIAKFFVVGMHAGSVPLKLTTATCDGSACALEWNLASWGEGNFLIFLSTLGGWHYLNLTTKGY